MATKTFSFPQRIFLPTALQNGKMFKFSFDFFASSHCLSIHTDEHCANENFVFYFLRSFLWHSSSSSFNTCCLMVPRPTARTFRWILFCPKLIKCVIFAFWTIGGQTRFFFPSKRGPLGCWEIFLKKKIFFFTKVVRNDEKLSLEQFFGGWGAQRCSSTRALGRTLETQLCKKIPLVLFGQFFIFFASVSFLVQKNLY